MLDDLPPPTLVQDETGLSRMLSELAGHREIAVDTEADSFFNYREQVCLVQITAGERDYLVDPLSGLDVRPLGGVLADPSVEKVFHDGEYDVLILKRDYGFRFAGLFDTRVAASAMGETAPGLASVLKARFAVELDKSMQRSDWSARPLTERQIRYARLDTRFLLPLARAQKAELASMGRAHIVAGECRRLEALVPSDPVFDPDEYVRLPGARKLSLQEQQNLRELFALRDRLARESNLPPFKVLSNHALVALAAFGRHAGGPQWNARGLANVPGLSAKQAKRHGDAILRALERARTLGPLPRSPSLAPRDGTGGMSDEEQELYQRLKTWRRDQAQTEGLDAALVLNRHALPSVARRRPRTRTELAQIEALLPWQLESYGDALLDVVRRSLDEFAAGWKPTRRRGQRGR
jgi:ribonuclease D